MTPAREVIRQALTEKQAELEEIDRLKASREEFKAEYLKLIQHFMDDAQNSFPADLMASTAGRFCRFSCGDCSRRAAARR